MRTAAKRAWSISASSGLQSLRVMLKTTLQQQQQQQQQQRWRGHKTYKDTISESEMIRRTIDTHTFGHAILEVSIL